MAQPTDTARAASERRAEFFGRLLDAAPIFFWAGSSDFEVGHLSSNAARAITGYDALEFAQRPSLWFELIHPDDLPVAQAANERATATGEPQSFECRIRHADGSTRWIRDVIMVRHAADGSIDDLYGYVIDVTSIKESEIAVRALLERQRVMQQEIHHRVKNNLQLVASLISLHGEQPGGASALRGRILAVARLHDSLSVEDDGHVDVAAYFDSLLDQLLALQQKNVRLDRRLEPLLAPVDIALPAGLVLHELVSNALEHGGTDNDVATVHVELTLEGTTGILVVGDGGDGPSPEHLEGKTGSLGLRLVRNLVEQLGGELSSRPFAHANAVCVRFPTS